MPCVFCNTKLIFDDATIEHIIPFSKGGSHVIENLTISCKPCNSSRGSIAFDAWKRMAFYYKIVRVLKKNGKIIGNCLLL